MSDDYSTGLGAKRGATPRTLPKLPLTTKNDDSKIFGEWKLATRRYVRNSYGGLGDKGTCDVGTLFEGYFEDPPRIDGAVSGVLATSAALLQWKEEEEDRIKEAFVGAELTIVISNLTNSAT